jgi:hypothetical protein
VHFAGVVAAQHHGDGQKLDGLRLGETALISQRYPDESYANTLVE